MEAEQSSYYREYPIAFGQKWEIVDVGQSDTANNTLCRNCFQGTSVFALKAPGAPVFGHCPSRKPPAEYGRVFSRTASKKLIRLYTDYERGVKQSNKENTVKWHVLSMSELLQKHVRACASRMFFDGSDVEEEKLREALAWHAQCWEKDEVDLSVAAAGMKKVLAPRS